LAVGATIAGMAYLNYSLLQSAYTDFLYAGDLFRIAAVAAWGIGTVRVISEYQRTHAETVRLEERRRVARHLHDGVAQELAFMSTQMQWLAREVGPGPAASQIMDSLQRALDESRGAISALSRPAYEPLHLALAHAAEEVAGRLGARLKLELEEGVAVSAAWEEALPQILREAVANAVRNGRARRVTVHLRDKDGIWLRISDDGEGFDVSHPRSDTNFGLAGIKERTESLGGEFKLTSEPGQGTSVEILLP